MARGQVAKPQFFVDYFLWLNTIGSLDYNDITFDNSFAINVEDDESGRIMESGIPLISSLLRLDPNVASAIPIVDGEGNDYSNVISKFTVPTGLNSGYVDHDIENGSVNDLFDLPLNLDRANFNINYVSFLNHNFSTANCFPYLEFESWNESGGEPPIRPSLTEIINFSENDDGQGAKPSHDGFSVCSFTPINESIPHRYIEKLKLLLFRII